MFNIKLYDNKYQGFKLADVSDFAKLEDSEKAKIRKALDSINNLSLKELEKKGVIVFPTNAVEKELDASKKEILSVQNLMTEPTIKTGNIMGFFSIGNDVQIEIRSRFDNDDKQFFLHYMLSKVCNVAPTITLTDANNDPFYEFCVYLFPTFLKKAVTQGLFRTYVTREYNDSNIRGVIDFPRHFRNNIPFNGKIAYRTREYSHDNFTMQLVRHTIEFISENNSLRKILSIDENMRNAVQNIRGCTESYTKSARNFIINKNLKPITHPYYTEYEPLRRLCLMILTHKRISYGQKKEHQINGILFDGASLWEEYLNVVLREQMRNKPDYKDYELKHPNNRTGVGKEHLFENEKHPKIQEIYPDFILKKSEKVEAIIDAKYKRLENGVDNADYFQLLAYMFRFSCNRGMLIYPYASEKEKADSDSESLYLKDHDQKITFETLGLEIPTNQEKFDGFCDAMKGKENQLLETIQKRLTSPQNINL